MMETVVFWMLMAVVMAVSVYIGTRIVKWPPEKKVHQLVVAERARIEPTGKTAFVTLDWVRGNIIAAISFADSGKGAPTLMASIRDGDGDPDYFALAQLFVSNCAACEEAMGLRNREETIAEIKSWNIVVSATGRAHNALSAPRHCTVEFSDAIKIAKASLYGWCN